MAAIRMLYQSHENEISDQIRKEVIHARDRSGCLQAEMFRGVEFPEKILVLELWESPAAWDVYWSALKRSREVEKGDDPWMDTNELKSRKTADCGLEFYKQSTFKLSEGVWMNDQTDHKIDSVRWQAQGPIRIIVQIALDPTASMDVRLEEARRTREEAGCLQFDYFRSIDFPENISVIESWSGPKIYDEHWLNRLAQKVSGATERRAPVARKYGQSTFEWYEEHRFVLSDGIFWPEDTDKRMSTVRW